MIDGKMFYFKKKETDTTSQWLNKRQAMEEKLPKRSSKRRKIAQKIAKTFPVSLLDHRGKKNIFDIRVNKKQFFFSNLPKHFSGFSILHISDPHFDSEPRFVDALCMAVNNISADLVVITGDFQFGYGQHSQENIMQIKKFIDHLCPELPCLASLGNHDQASLASQNIHEKLLFLTNQSLELYKEHYDKPIIIYGLDEAVQPDQFPKSDHHFGICLGHSVETAQIVAKQGWDFMLAGHSHGGQICLPFGKPIFLSIERNRHIAIGSWHAFDMQGHTSKGAGVSGLPWRFNCPAEISILTLYPTDP